MSAGVMSVTALTQRYDKPSLDNWGSGRGKGPPKKGTNSMEKRKTYGSRKPSQTSETSGRTSKASGSDKIESNVIRDPPQNGRRASKPTRYTVEQSLQRVPTKDGLNKRTASLYLSRATTKITIKDTPEGSPLPAASPKTSLSRKPSMGSLPSRTSGLSRRSSGAVVPVSNNLLTLHREYTREFTFTGYDIMKDVPKKPVIDDAEELERRQRIQVYEGSCKRLGVTPANYVTRNLSSRAIVMKGHDLGPLGAKAVAIALVNNDKVHTLDISDNHIGSEGVRAISEMTYANSVLSEICLGWNQLSTAGVRVLCGALRENETVKKLDLSGNHLKDLDARYVADLVENNIGLRELLLSHNDFREMGGEYLSKALSYNDTIEHLDLSWNHLRGKGAFALGKNLYQNLGLKRLNISWNGFGENGAKAIGASLLRNHTLVELDVTNNRISPEGIKSLMNGTMKNDTLRILHIGRNPITPEVAKNILNFLKKIPDSCALEEIEMSDITVDYEFVDMLAAIKERRYIRVSHGAQIKLSSDLAGVTSDVFMDRDPVKTLFDFMAAEGYRVVDLFNRLDLDKSQSVSKQEFRDGMVKIKVPLTSVQLDVLMDVLDKDNDGEVDLRELQDEMNKEKRKKRKRLKKAKIAGKAATVAVSLSKKSAAANVPS